MLIHFLPIQVSKKQMRLKRKEQSKKLRIAKFIEQEKDIQQRVYDRGDLAPMIWA
jgi:hypothetical protein